MILRHLTLAHARLAASLLLIGALSACVGAAREPVDSLSGLGGGETVVVGRIELVPPLRKDEQKLKGLNSSSFENKVFLLADEHYRVLTDEPGMSDYAGRIEAILGKNFFVRSNNKPFFILGGMMYLDLGGQETNRAYFPGGLKVSLKPGDKAVYVGTVRYHRNEFFEVTKAAIVDDYDRANAEFKKKFGTKTPLRKALLTPVK
ncbi:MAG TPA: hypothetical protein VLB06_06660 [Sulfuricaulis sp.]|nr:hypothetical protein [Sulfuricaulis sp.]